MCIDHLSLSLNLLSSKNKNCYSVMFDLYYKLIDDGDGIAHDRALMFQT